MSWRSPRLPVRPGCWGARLIERWLRDQQGSMLVCRKQVVWRDQYGPTPRWDPRYRNGRPDKVSTKLDVRLGGRFRNHHIHHSNDLVLGPAIRTLQPLHLATVAIGDSAHGMRGSAGPAPNARHEVHLTLLSLRPLASLHHQTPQYPQNAALSAAEEEAPSFLLSKVTQLRLAPIRLSPGAAAAVCARRPHEVPAPSSDRNGGRYWVRNNAQTHTCPMFFCSHLGRSSC